MRSFVNYSVEAWIKSAIAVRCTAPFRTTTFSLSLPRTQEGQLRFNGVAVLSITEDPVAQAGHFDWPAFLSLWRIAFPAELKPQLVVMQDDQSSSGWRFEIQVHGDGEILRLVWGVYSRQVHEFLQSLSLEDYHVLLGEETAERLDVHFAIRGRGPQKLSLVRR